MNAQSIAKSIEAIKKDGKKRKFSQTVEFILNLRGLDLKKPDHQMDFYTVIKHPWKKQKICGFVGAELQDQAKKVFDEVILVDDFGKWKEKKQLKKLARDYDYFVAQANLMPQVASSFGKMLGPLGKMPNPKAGCVVPPNANLEQLSERLQRTLRIQVKVTAQIQLGLGKEDADAKAMAEDAQHIYQQVVQHLPAEQQNIKSVQVKLTMGKPVKVE